MNLPESVEELLALIECERVAVLCKRFKKPPLPSRLLRSLIDAHGDSLPALAFVAAYPLSPSDVLERMGESVQDPAIAEGLATNPRTPPATLIRLMESTNPQVRAAVAKNPNLNPRDIQRLLQDNATEVAITLATNPALKPQHQAVLATHAEASVRVALLRNSNLETSILTALTTDPSPVVRCALAAQAKADESLLEFWADCDREEIQCALLQRRNLPDEILQSLAFSPHAQVRMQVRDAVVRSESLMLFWAEQGSVEERLWLAGLELLPYPLQTILSQNDESEVRCALARNPKLDDRIADYFITTGETEECLALLDNPAKKSAWLKALAQSGNPEVIAALMYEPELDSALLDTLINQRLSAEAVLHLSAQKRTFPGLKQELAYVLGKYAHPAIRRFAASAQTIPGENAFIVENRHTQQLTERLDALLSNLISP